MASYIIEEHHQYLSDNARIRSFSEAISCVVKPGCVVLDLCSGTGILGLLACRAGAAKVYSIEEHSIIQLARDISRANSFSDRTVFLKGNSRSVTLPEKVDVIVGDQIGHFGLEAGLLETFSDARDRFLKPDGHIIPRLVELHVAPIENPALWKEIDFWNSRPVDFDLGPAFHLSKNTAHPCRIQEDQVLSTPEKVASFEMLTASSVAFSASREFRVLRRGVFHGIGCWFNAELAPGAFLTNSPFSSDRIRRRNTMLPAASPIQVEPGDLIQLDLHVSPLFPVYAWEVTVHGTRFSHSTFVGMLLSREDVYRTRPRFVPRLTDKAKAFQIALQLIDGGRAVTEIEEELLRSDPGYFRSRDEVEKFVAEVVFKYAQEN